MLDAAGTTSLVKYAYDAFSRLVSAAPASGTATLRVYDGWNPITEYAGQDLAKTYHWGMDLSGTMQGAGGVGGLLAVRIHGTGTSAGLYHPTYDGNGNISEPERSGDGHARSRVPAGRRSREYLTPGGSVAAHYVYDPFGNDITPSNRAGTAHNAFAHRFSTKPIDPATGLYYYGYRFYDPLTGRWPSRDPIGEEGGVNLYGFDVNSPLSWIDFLGNEPMVPGNLPPVRPKVDGQAIKNTITRNWWCCDRSAIMKEGHQRSTQASALTQSDYIPPDAFLGIGGTGKTTKPTREYCGLICCNKTGKVKSTEPHPGHRTIAGKMALPDGRIIYAEHTCDPLENGACRKIFGPDWKTVGAYHSHPEGSKQFSSDDDKFRTHMLDRRLLFLGTTDGTVRVMENGGPKHEKLKDGGSQIVDRPKISIVSEDGLLTPEDYEKLQ